MVSLPVLCCMHSSEQVEVALVAYLTRCLLTPYFWPEGVVGGEGGCSTLSGASTGCPWGLLLGAETNRKTPSLKT